MDIINNAKFCEMIDRIKLRETDIMGIRACSGGFLPIITIKHKSCYGVKCVTPEEALRQRLAMNKVAKVFN